MSESAFTISAFGDEIADDLADQLRVLRELRIEYLELRGAWGKNVLHLDDDEVERVRRICGENGIAVSSIGSPIGKSAITDPIENEMSNLARIFEIGERVGTHTVRVFSFYPPDTATNALYDAYVEEATSRLGRLTVMAETHGFRLMLENERAIVGDTVARCHAIVSAIDSAHLRFLWDPANFLVVGEVQPTERGWPLLGSYVGYVHVKDALLDGGRICPAGEGDGQVGALLTKLHENGYRGFLGLEPHLKMAGHSGGFSGPDGMAVAVNALRQLMGSLGIESGTH